MAHKYEVDLELNYKNFMSELEKAQTSIDGVVDGVRLDVALDPKSIEKLKSQVQNLIDAEPTLGISVALSVDKSQIALFENEIENITNNIQKKTYDKSLSKQAEKLFSKFEDKNFMADESGDKSKRDNYFKEEITQFIKLVNTYKQFGAKFEDSNPAAAYLENFMIASDHYYDLIEELSSSKVNIFNLTSRKSVDDSMAALKAWGREIQDLAEQYNVSQEDITEMLGVTQRAAGQQNELSDASEKTEEQFKEQGDSIRATSEEMQKLLEVLDKVTASLSEISEKIKSLNIKELGDIKIDNSGFDRIVNSINEAVLSLKQQDINMTGIDDLIGKIGVLSDNINGELVESIKATNLSIDAMSEKLGKKQSANGLKNIASTFDNLNNTLVEIEKKLDNLIIPPTLAKEADDVADKIKDISESDASSAIKNEIELVELLTSKFNEVLDVLRQIKDAEQILSTIKPVNNYYGGNSYTDLRIDEDTINNIQKLAGLLETVAGDVGKIRSSFEALTTTIQQLPISNMEALVKSVSDTTEIEALKNKLLEVETRLEEFKLLQNDISNNGFITATGSIDKIISDEISNLQLLINKVKDVEGAINDKTSAFEAESDKVKKVVEEETSNLDSLLKFINDITGAASGIGDVFRSLNDISEAAKAIDPKSFSWITSLKGINADKLTEISDALKTFSDEIKGIDVSGSAFLNDIKELTNHSKELENLAKIVSKSKKQIKAAKTQTDQEQLNAAYNKRLALQRKINEQNVKLLKNSLNINITDEARQQNQDALQQTLNNYSASLNTVQSDIAKYEAALGKSTIQEREFNDVVKQGRQKLIEQRKLLETSNISKRQEELDSLKKKYQDLAKSISQYLNQDKYTDVVTGPFEETKEDINKALEKLDSLNINDSNIGKGLSDASDKLNEINGKIAENKKLTKQADAVWMDSFKISGLKTRITTFADKVLGGELKSRIVSLGDSINTGAKMTKEQFKEISNTFERFKEEAVSTGQIGTGFFDLIGKKLKGVNAQLIAYFFSWMDIIRYVRSGIDAIREIDYALIDLRKTTTMSSSDLNQFYYDANDVAKQMGITTAQVVDLASSFSRLGYSSKEAATEMAKEAAKFALISPGMDTETAQTGMVSIQKAFKIANEDIEREILDNINIIGNNFATSNDEIIAGLERGASAMAVANNSLEETIALFASGQEITQDAEKMGTALRTKNCALHIEICA